MIGTSEIFLATAFFGGRQVGPFEWIKFISEEIPQDRLLNFSSSSYSSSLFSITRS
jgi:hypothetical protein